MEECKKVDDNRESSSPSTDKELLEQRISSKRLSPHGNSSPIRKLLDPDDVYTSDPNQQGPVQKDTTILSELKPHVTPEKDKKYHVWFQETNTQEPIHLKIQENAPSLVDPHLAQNSEDFTDTQTKTECLANLEEYSALEVLDSEAWMFLESNPYLNQESQNILLELQKGIPLENLHKMKQITTDLKCSSDDSGPHLRNCRKHFSAAIPPSCEMHKSKKQSSSSQRRSPDRLYPSSLSATEVPSISSASPSSGGKHSRTTRSRTSCSSAPLTESNIKLHLAKSQHKPHRHPESKGRKKARFDSSGKKNIQWNTDYSCAQSKAKYERKKKTYDYESESLDYFIRKHKFSIKTPRVYQLFV